MTHALYSQPPTLHTLLGAAVLLLCLQLSAAVTCDCSSSRLALPSPSPIFGAVGVNPVISKGLPRQRISRFRWEKSLPFPFTSPAPDWLSLPTTSHLLYVPSLPRESNCPRNLRIQESAHWERSDSLICDGGYRYIPPNDYTVLTFLSTPERLPSSL